MKPLPKHSFSASPEWDEQAFMAAHTQPSIVSLRLNPHKVSKLDWGIDSTVPWCSNGIYLKERPVFTLDPLLHAGAYYVQEASSMFLQHAYKQLIQKNNGSLRVLDLCAAPGGKSSLLAALLNKNDLLVANEVIQNRAAILSENLTRWGQMNTWVSNNDPKDFSKLPAYFDAMVIDAPCTGSGLWRKDEAAIDEWSEAHVKLCSERQKRILSDALPALKDGGILFYATCSFSTEEDEEILDWISDNYEVESLKIPVENDWKIVETTSSKHQNWGYRFYPWLVKGEGFFLAAMRIKNERIPAIAISKNNNFKKLHEIKNRWSEYLTTDFELLEKVESYIAINPNHVSDYDLLSSTLRIRKSGTMLGKVLPKELIPDHELALSTYLSESTPAVHLDKQTALQYLKKENISTNGEKGWYLVRYQGLALGWGKWLGNRMNNYFPKNWRIRMDIE